MLPSLSVRRGDSPGVVSNSCLLDVVEMGGCPLFESGDGFEQRAPERRQFVSHAGRRMTISSLGDLFKRWTKTARLDKHVTAMVLRHSIASHLLENGMGVRLVQEFLGHDKLATTQIYAKVTLSGLRKSYNKAHPKEKRARNRKKFLDEAQ